MGTLSVDKLVKTSSGAAEFTLPATDGTAGQVMQTDGSGQLSVAALAADTVTATQIAANAVGNSEMADDAVGLAELSATGTASATTFLRGDNSWAVAGGLTHYSQWRLNANFTGDKIPITGTLLEAVIAADPTTSTASPTSSTAVGAPMAYDSTSGSFTFPVTGYWNIFLHANWLGNSNIDYLRASIAGTTNNSAYNIFATGGTASQKATGDDIYVQTTTEVLFDVTSTSTHKVRFEIDVETGTPTCLGVASGSGYNRTFMTFIKIADT